MYRQVLLLFYNEEIKEEAELSDSGLVTIFSGRWRCPAMKDNLPGKVVHFLRHGKCSSNGWKIAGQVQSHQALSPRSPSAQVDYGHGLSSEPWSLSCTEEVPQDRPTLSVHPLLSCFCCSSQLLWIVFYLSDCLVWFRFLSKVSKEYFTHLEFQPSLLTLFCSLETASLGEKLSMLS